MSRLASGFKTPSKKNQPFKPQRNTIDQYLDKKKDKPSSKDENLANKQTPLTRSKRKSQGANNNGPKKRKKTNDTFGSKIIISEETTSSSPDVCPRKSQLQPTTTPAVNHVRRDSASSDVKGNSNSKSKSKRSSLRKHSSNEITESNEQAKILYEPFFIESVNDSVEINDIGTPKHHSFPTSPLKQTVQCKLNPVRLVKDEIDITDCSSGEILHTGKSQLNEVKEDHDVLVNTGGKIQVPSEERKKISASYFKEIINNFCNTDFLKPYQKLSCSPLPKCYDLKHCRSNHETTGLKEVNSFHYGHVFNILDNPLSEWMSDIRLAITLVLNRHQYLRGDMLRIIFDYIMNGPNEDLMWDLKAILETHWSLHPPCSGPMRELYLQLLDRRYPGDSFFKTDLTKSGVLVYVLEQLKKVLKSEMGDEETCKSENNPNDELTDSVVPELTFELLEERFNSLQPLYEEEQKKAVDTVDDLANISQAEKDSEVLSESEKLNRLTVALEIIVNLLEDDFVVCVSRLKSHLKGECEMVEPLVKYFMDDANTFQKTILKLFVTTTNKNTWKQLSRLVGLLAETIHLFRDSQVRTWKYPNLNSDCEHFATLVFQAFSEGEWEESEVLAGLMTLRPPWLQQRVTLAVANSHLNLVLGTGIQAVVDIIHTHVISPVKMEKNLIRVEPDSEKLIFMSGKLKKKSKKKNQYGETLLHEVCKKAQFTVDDLECLLAMPETDVNVRDNYEWRPLHEAVFAKSLPKIEMLLQFQPPPGRDAVDIGAQNKDGTTPLHEAVLGNCLDICHLLVQYGGVNLLKKKNNEGMTPEMLAENRAEILKYFNDVLKIQEKLNLNSNSVLKLSDSMISMCMVVCEAYIADHFTWDLYQVFKFDKDYDRTETQSCVAASSKAVLTEFKQDQDHLRKLRRILEKLAENPENSHLVRIWNDRFVYRDVQSGKL